jgi:hypothetical protein
MSCPHENGCPLFPLFRLKASLGVWRTQYCDGDHTACARYRLSHAGNRVPSNLLPNGKSLELPAFGANR